MLDLAQVIGVVQVAGAAGRVAALLRARLSAFLVDSGIWSQAMSASIRRDARGRFDRTRRAVGGAVRGGAQINGVNAIMHQAHPTPDESDFGGVLQFGHVDENRWDVVQWRMRWPVLLARIAYGGADAPSRGARFRGLVGLDVHWIWTAAALQFGTVADIIAVTKNDGQGGGRP